MYQLQEHGVRPVGKLFSAIFVVAIVSMLGILLLLIAVGKVGVSEMRGRLIESQIIVATAERHPQTNYALPIFAALMRQFVSTAGVYDNLNFAAFETPRVGIVEYEQISIDSLPHRQRPACVKLSGIRKDVVRWGGIQGHEKCAAMEGNAARRPRTGVGPNCLRRNTPLYVDIFVKFVVANNAVLYFERNVPLYRYPWTLRGLSKLVLADHCCGRFAGVFKRLSGSYQSAAHIPESPESEAGSYRAYYENSERPERHIPLGLQVALGVISFTSGLFLFYLAFVSVTPRHGTAESIYAPFGVILIFSGALAIAFAIASP